MAGTPLLDVNDVAKSYDGAAALSGVTLHVGSAEVRGLVGENGAGKSTLIKVLTGSVRPDRGTALFDGRPIPFGDPLGCARAGIGVIHQEPTLFPDLSIEDNLALGREKTWARGLVLDRRSSRAEAARLMDALGQDLPFGVPVGRFSIAHRQMVAVARALAAECRLLIMDEPTASLSPREAKTLHETVRRLNGQGVSVLFVSHRLEEVLQLCHSVTVLRDGAIVETRPATDFDHGSLIRSMIGRDVPPHEPRPSARGPVALRARSLGRKGAIDDVSFDVHAGEVLGIGGLVGSGRTETVRILAGLDRADRGHVEANGSRLKPGDLGAALKAGIALVPEDRRSEGLVLPLSVRTNLVLAVRDRLARAGLIARKAEEAVVTEQTAELRIKTAGPGLPVAALSGGNQQKVVVGKWLSTRPKVVILDEPTRGVDIGAKSEIHRIVRGLADSGQAVIVVSSDLPELLSISDRILVMAQGKIAGEVSAADATEERVMALSFSGGAP